LITADLTNFKIAEFTSPDDLYIPSSKQQVLQVEQSETLAETVPEQINSKIEKEEITTQPIDSKPPTKKKKEVMFFPEYDNENHDSEFNQSPPVTDCVIRKNLRKRHKKNYCENDQFT